MLVFSSEAACQLFVPMYSHVDAYFSFAGSNQLNVPTHNMSDRLQQECNSCV